MEIITKEEMKEKIENGISEIIESGKFANYLRFCSKMRHYSFNNKMLIFIQKTDASHINSFKRWKELKRYVVKGQKAIKIMAPLMRTIRVKDDEGSEVKKQIIKGFKYVNVFDISQTEGEELTTSLCENFGSDSEMYSEFKSIISKDFPVQEMPLGESCGGMTDGGKIFINDSKSDEQKLKILIHELAHCKLHFGADRNESSINEKEIQAEATAFMVCETFGIDASSYSFGYLAGWSKGNAEAVLNALDIAFNTATQIIEMLENKPLKDKAA